jgi:copper(I)-binding protein
MRPGSRLVLVAAAVALVAIGAILLWPRKADVAFRKGDIVVSEPWARATPGPVRIGVAYMTIANRGSAPDRLLRVETPAAERAELHTTVVQNGVMQMRPVESVALPPGHTVQFAPGSMHIMLVELKAPLEEGGRFDMRLIFERTGGVDIQVPILAVGASELNGSMGGEHNH